MAWHLTVRAGVTQAASTLRFAPWKKASPRLT
jgi:hypothetical protein